MTQTRLVNPPLAEDEREGLEGDFRAFTASARQAGEKITGFTNPLVVHHYDADGLAAASITSLALLRARVPHSLMMQKRVDKPVLEQVLTEASRTPAGRQVVFVDLGSGQLQLVADYLLSAGLQVSVIDHHLTRPLQASPPAGLLAHVNPSLHGFDGGSSACSASTAYYCFKDLHWTGEDGGKRTNNDLSVLGIVGAVGDMQDQAGLRSLNRVMLNQALEAGYATRTRGLRLFGRVSRPLVNFLSYAQEPPLPGLSGDERACARFLAETRIPFYIEETRAQDDGLKTSTRFLRYSDLTEELQKKLSSAIITHCLNAGMKEEAVKRLFGEVYEFPRQPQNTELADAYEFSTLLNACGRNGRSDLGIGVCTGQTDAFEGARQVLSRHRAVISAGLRFAREKTSDLGAFYLLDARGLVPETVVGTVIGAHLATADPGSLKPILGLALEEDSGGIKVSARATSAAVSAGLDLNQVMRVSAESVNGLGGGHKIAAGATIPAGKENEFLLACKKQIEAQTSPSTN